jgi:hypothetical protein
MGDAPEPPPLAFLDGAIEVDAALVAGGLGIAPSRLIDLLRSGKITSLCERGIDEDSGRYRLTFFSESGRFRLVVDESGRILQRSSLDFGGRPLPASARKPGG